MHIGIIWLLLDRLLRPLVWMRLRWLKGMAVIGTLWAFAFVVGLEASVVRAVIMCMLMEISLLAGVKPFSLNTLSIAALGMLLYRPFYLFDVGFQLSFVAVASILWLYPLIVGIFRIKNRMLRWSWSALSVSMAAQLGTAPWVMYYFSLFSVYFLLTNWVAAILVPFIICGALLMVLTAWLPGVQCYVVDGVNGMVALLNSMAGWTSTLPYASFSLSVLRPVEIVMFYLVLGAWVKFAMVRRRIWFIRSLVVTACLLGIHLFLLLMDRFG
jgi:competence protein ComEC